MGANGKQKRAVSIYQQKSLQDLGPFKLFLIRFRIGLPEIEVGEKQTILRVVHRVELQWRLVLDKQSINNYL